MPPISETLAFGVAFVSGLTPIALTLVATVSSGFQFFPPPSPSAWQARTFRYLFRSLFAALLVLTALTFEPPAAGDLARVAFGAALTGIGFGVAIHATLQLGWQTAFGDRGGLRTGGWFRLSRNPVYVATWVGLAGWALLIPDPRVILVLATWAMTYVLAPLPEEDWLRRQYVRSYARYAAATPRFL